MISSSHNLGLFPANGFDLSLDEIAQICPTEKLNWSVAKEAGVSVYVKREDLLHPHWGGNKFYKSYHHLAAAQNRGVTRIATFGGPYSNHLLALAAICQVRAWSFTALVRGERPAVLSPTLKDVAELGGTLHFMSRSEYREGCTDTLQNKLCHLMGGAVAIVPEGGAGMLGSQGVYTWVHRTLAQAPPVDGLYMAAGTGGTLAGALAAAGKQNVVGVLALKGRETELAELKTQIVTHAEALRQQMSQPRQLDANISLETNYHWGGYAKYPSELATFQAEFETETGLTCDRVYTVKVFSALADHLRQGRWRRGDNLLVLHTGGLQGNRQIL